MIGKNVWKKSECRLQLVHFMIKIKTENGGVKKRHYHGIYIANNPVTADAVRRKIKAVLSSEDIECKAVARVQVIYESVENTYLYLTHESKDAIKKISIDTIKQILNISAILILSVISR